MRQWRLDIVRRGFSVDTFMMVETFAAVATTHLFKDFTPAALLANQAVLDRVLDAKELFNTRLGNFSDKMASNHLRLILFVMQQAVLMLVLIYILPDTLMHLSIHLVRLKLPVLLVTL